MAKKKKVEEQPQVIVQLQPTWSDRVRERNSVKK